MKKAAFFTAPVIALLLAGCASEPAKVADASPCKVAPLPVGSIDSYGGHSSRPVDKLDQERALAQLQATPYYRQQLQRRGYANNTLADAVRDCY